LALLGVLILLVLIAGLFRLQSGLVEPISGLDVATGDEELVEVEWVELADFDAFVHDLVAREDGDFFDPDSVRIRSDESLGVSFASAIAPRSDALDILSILRDRIVVAGDFPSLVQRVAVARWDSGDIRGGGDVLARYPEFLDAACIGVDMPFLDSASIGVDTPLTWSIRAGNYEAFRSILRLGANVDALNTESVPPLLLAASHDHDPRFALDLLDGGADTSARLPRDGSSALHHADTPEVVRALLSRGIDVDVGDSRGDTPLHRARTSAIVRTLIDHGAAVNATNSRGETPLHRAATPEVAAALLALGADVNARNQNGDTPLHLALSRGAALVRVLVEGGANLGATNRSGQTPLMRLESRFPSQLPLDDEAELRALLREPAFEGRQP
jgi:hypothetical protein